jgi:hypothetical protein
MFIIVNFFVQSLKPQTRIDSLIENCCRLFVVAENLGFQADVIALPQVSC